MHIAKIFRIRSKKSKVPLVRNIITGTIYKELVEYKPYRKHAITLTERGDKIMVLATNIEVMA